MSGRRSEPGTYRSADLTDPVFALCPVRAPLVSVEGYTLHAIHLLPQLGVLDGKTIAANNRSDADEVLPRRHVYPAIYPPRHATLSIPPAAAAPLAILTLTTLTLKVLLRRSQRLGGWVHAIKEESAAAVRQHEAARQVSAASL